MSRVLPAIVLSLCASPSATPAETPAALAPAPRRLPVEDWVKQLGHAEVGQREAAEQRLSTLTAEPPPELLAATASADAALRERAARVVQAMQGNLAAARLPRGMRFADRGCLDLFVAATAAWDLKPEDDRLWTPAVDLGRRLIEKADLTGDRKPHNCPSSFKDYATYKRLVPPRFFTRLDELYTCPDPNKSTPWVPYHRQAIHAAGVVSSTGIVTNLIVSRGDVRFEKGVQSSVILANGDVTVPGVISSSVIVCDGDATVCDREITNSLVVARGTITVKGTATAATLIAGNRANVLAQRKIVDRNSYNIIHEKEMNPLGAFAFFELSTIGFEVAVAEKSIRVSAVAAGKSCGMAGMKVGDVILKVGDKAPTDAESLRRLLRDALAVGDAAVTLKRGDTTEVVKVSLPD